MSTKNLNIRNPKKGFYGLVTKMPVDLEKQKTVTVSVLERKYLKKYKRFYKKETKYQVHCDLNNEVLNPNKIKEIKLKDSVYCVYTRRISKMKSSAIYFGPQ